MSKEDSLFKITVKTWNDRKFVTFFAYGYLGWWIIKFVSLGVKKNQQSKVQILLAWFKKQIQKEKKETENINI